jgi:hypothetical protein
MGEMENLVGCKIIDTVDKGGVWIHQPKLLKNLKDNFALVAQQESSRHHQHLKH